jgi:hypothetical protein
MSDELKKFCAALTAEEQEQVLDFLLDDADAVLADSIPVPMWRYEDLIRSETELKAIYALCESYRYDDNTFRKLVQDCKAIRG